ncbi:MAG: hypothetical protein SGILL_005134 [Bacillariaceae sp.]
MNIVPPADVMPVDIENAEEKLREKSATLRSTIFDVAKQRAASSGRSGDMSSSWIPVLSEVSGLLVDATAAKSLRLDPRFFKQQELSNIMWALTNVKRPSERVFAFVVNSIILSQQNSKNNKGRDNEMLKPQEWSIPLWCLAKTGILSGHEEELFPFVRDLMDNEAGFLESFRPQELSNSIWAAATILSNRDEAPEGAASEAALDIVRHVAREMIRRDGDRYTSQELTNTAWAMATLGFGTSNDNDREFKNLANSYTYLPTDDAEGDKALMQACLGVCKQRMKEMIEKFQNQELNNMCWAMARLDEKDEELLGMIGEELVKPRRRLRPQDLSTSLWSMATMEYFNEDLYRAIVARVPSIGVHRFKPQELSNTLWALATAGVTPGYPNAFDFELLPDSSRPTLQEVENEAVTNCFRLVTEEMMHRLQQYKPQEIKDALWAVTKVGLRHPRLFRFVAEHLVGKGDDPSVRGRGLEPFDGQGISNVAYVFARHAQLGAEVLQKYGKRCRLPVTGGRLACYTVSYLDIGEGLLRKLYAEIARVDLSEKLPYLSSQDVANTAWGFAIQGLKHKALQEAISQAYQQRMKNYLDARKGRRSSIAMIKGQEITNTAWALATLNCTPKGFLSSLEEYLVAIFDGEFTVAKISKIFTRQELANLGFALAVFGEYPSRLVELIYTGLIGIGDRSDPSYVQKHYDDSGIEQSHINCLVYLQTLLDLELGKTAHRFSLPDDFPSGWTGDLSKITSPSASDDSMVARNLEINTSNTQKAVSAAFDRLDFGHVDEDIHTMKDLVEMYGVQMASCPMEILSMDIANVESRIGIELDGPGHFITDIDNRENLLSDVGFYRLNNKDVHEYTFAWNSHDQEVNGSTALKLRVFDLLGWQIFNIPFWEWAKIYNNKKKEEEYCQTVILDKIAQ